MQQVVQMMQRIKSVNGINEKKAILSEFKDDPTVKEYLHYVLNPFKMFNMTSKNLLPEQGKKPMEWPQAKLVLDQLHNREKTGHEATEFAMFFLYGMMPEHQELFYAALDKDLAAGMGAKLVNDIFPELVPQFDVQLCAKYDDLEKLPFKNTFVSRKLDGVRVVAIKEDKEFRFYSREGREFLTLGKLKAALEDHFHTLNHQGGIVLDGEVCIVDDKGTEDFIQVVSQIKRKDFTIENPKYLLFDMLNLQDFLKLYCDIPFETRYSALQQVMDSSTAKYWGVLKQTKCPTVDLLKSMVEAATEFKWEGLILKNGDAPYEGKRSKNLLKVKKFYDHEFKIVGVQEGKGMFEGMLGALIIEGEYDGKKIFAEVGSGFKQKFSDPTTCKDPDPDGDRIKLWNIRDKIVGQTTTVQFFEVSKNKEGTYSLRFPTFKVLHGQERTT
jgi:DNA ligase-1